MSRNATLDLARLAAAFGIVLFHAGAPGRMVGYAALPFFLIVLILLGLPGAAKRPFRSYAASRARRLLWPWAIWSGFYGGLKLAEVALTQKVLAEEFQPSMLLTGPALHLWFLPFAFVASLFLPPLMRFWPQNARGQGLILTGLLLLGLASLMLQQTAALGPPWAQWSFALPAVFIGMALGLAQLGQGAGQTAAVTGGLLLCGGLALMLGWTAGLLQLGLASAATLLCLLLPSRETAFSRFSARASMTVYLLHPFVLSLLTRLTGQPSARLSMALLAMLVTFACAAGLEWIKARKP